MSSVEKDPGKAFWIARVSRIVRLLRVVDLFYQRMAAVTRRRNSCFDHVLACLGQRGPAIGRPECAVSPAPDPDSREITGVEFFPIHIDQAGIRCRTC